jgi:major membrane immunogen (membrane-anchored lipoprotein)
MMKKSFVSLLAALLLTIPVSTSYSTIRDNRLTDNIVQDTVVRIKDGTYKGISRSKYRSEPYWGQVRLTLKNGHYTEVIFVVRDSNLHETFDSTYEKHFAGNPYYIQQSRNDWKGVQTYPKKLLKEQDINKIDAISGATWSYNIFRSSVNEALKNAK